MWQEVIEQIDVKQDIEPSVVEELISNSPQVEGDVDEFASFRI